MNIHPNITTTIGKTPLVRLNHLAPQTGTGLVAAKIEYANPSASVKDRLALALIAAAEESGQLKAGGTIIEATSGNTGIGLAMIGAARGYQVVLTMPESMSQERRALLGGFGAELILTPASAGMKGAVDAAENAANERGGVVMRQFENAANAEMHRRTTGPEIWEDTDGQVDIVIAGVGTGGTITGISQALKERNPAIKTIAVEPAESPLLSGGTPGPHVIQGIGANFVPGVLDTAVYDEVIAVPGAEALAMARRAAREEGLLTGISAGAALSAAATVAARAENADATIVVIIPSFGERYLSTALFAEEIL